MYYEQWNSLSHSLNRTWVIRVSIGIVSVQSPSPLYVPSNVNKCGNITFCLLFNVVSIGFSLPSSSLFALSCSLRYVTCSHQSSFWHLTTDKSGSHWSVYVFTLPRTYAFLLCSLYHLWKNFLNVWNTIGHVNSANDSLHWTGLNRISPKEYYTLDGSRGGRVFNALVYQDTCPGSIPSGGKIYFSDQCSSGFDQSL